MYNNEKTDFDSKDKREIFTVHPPLVFLIPRPYEGDDERKCNWYKKILGLEKETKVIRNKIKTIAVRHALKKAVTRQIIEKTLELNRRFINRKAVHDKIRLQD